MSDVPKIVLNDEKDRYNKSEGVFETYLPVEVRCSDKEQAQKVGRILHEHWNDD